MRADSSCQSGKGNKHGKGAGQDVQRNQVQNCYSSGRLRPIGRQLSSMYATTGSIVVNKVVPVLTHYKLYKERDDIY